MHVAKRQQFFKTVLVCLLFIQCLLLALKKKLIVLEGLG
jgi:hypothetical protein